MGGYQTFHLQPGKQPTVSEDIGSGQIQLSHLDPALFLQVKAVQTHTHTGADSQQLYGATSVVPLSITSNQVNTTIATVLNGGSVIQSGATNFGGTIASGAIRSITISFAVPFKGTPSILLGGRGVDSNEQKVIYSYTGNSATQVTFNAYNASLITIADPVINFLAIGT